MTSTGLLRFNYLHPVWIEAETWVKGIEKIKEGVENVTFENCKGQPSKAWFQNFALAVRESSSIRAVSLNCKFVGDENAEFIADVVRNSQSLLTLLLNDCQIKDDGVIKIASGLRENKSLLYLGLLKNSINTDGIEALADALKRSDTKPYNRTLKKLSVLMTNALEQMEPMGQIQNAVTRNKKQQRKAYMDAFKHSSQGHPWRRTKLMLVGQGKAGKSALVRSFLSKPFEEEWVSTVGVKLTQTEMTMVPKRTIWSTIEAKTKMYHTAGLAARLAVQRLFSSTAWKSSSNTTSSKELRNRQQSSFNDERSNTFVENKEIKEMTEGRFDDKLLNKARDEDDEKTMTCSIWDYGGQNVFYTLHHLFLTRYGVYMIVFNMKELINDTDEAEKFLVFWLNSVRMHAEEAPVFLVGTFLDMVDSKEELNEVNNILRVLLRDRYPQVQLNDDEKLLFYPISNKTGEGTLKLREGVIEVAANQDHAEAKVSMRWMLCLDKLERNEKMWLKFSTELLQVAKEAGISDPGEVREMMFLFHQLGLVVHMTSTQIMSEFVVTNPQWLLDCISLVIRDKDIHSFENMDELENAGLKDDVQRLYNEGLVSRDLLNFLWETKEQVEFLLDIMKHTMLLNEWKFDDCHNLYLVPSLISTKKYSITLKDGLRCILDFSEDHLPTGAFQRLVCLCVAHSAKMNKSIAPTVKENYAKLSFGPKTELELLDDGNNQIIVAFENQAMAPIVLAVISSMLVRLKEGVLQRLSWNIKLQDGDKFVSYWEARENGVEPWFATARKITKSKDFQAFDMGNLLEEIREAYNAEEASILAEKTNQPFNF